MCDRRFSLQVCPLVCPRSKASTISPTGHFLSIFFCANFKPYYDFSSQGPKLLYPRKATSCNYLAYTFKNLIF